ncbi:MAG TPA: DNA polymerase III subunit alpha [Vicinamibacterales bacterium]|nr:DNA polymerase III subunit alpha [Vicinamibacterales bacterium]
MANEFVHLHLHTEFSLLDGACRIDELLDEAERLKMPALAVTEHGNMFSSVVFHDAARKRGINPILGCEVYVAPGDRRDKSGTPGETANHLVLLAENEKGFKNLIKLVSSGYTEGFYYKPRIDKQLLAQHAEGLIGLSSCLKGEVATGIREEQTKKALAAAAQYRDILGKGNFFLEMQFQGIEEQRIVNNGLLPIAKDLSMPLVVTNDVHYLRHGDHKPHDILLCIGTGKSVNDSQRLKYHGDQFFLKTAAQMAEVFGDYPEAMQNTMLIAERCNVHIPSGENHLPNFAVPEGFTLDNYFEHVTRQGFAQRLERLRQLEADGKLRHTIAQYEERLAYEIAMIKKMGYPGYFMIVWDFIRYAREHGIPVGPGRGSAAGSLAAWALRITDVDPLYYDLIFERFLNPERVSLPDIDVDFCERRRGEVIAYVTEKYGRENVSQIITFGTMKAKAVIRDVGRVMDMPYADVDRIAKQIPPALDMTLEKALAENPVLRDMAKNDSRVNDVLEMGKRLEGVSRNAGVHAAGVVIAPGPISDYAPLYKSNRDEITTQWAMKEVERVGLLKMDFLGLSTLTLIQDALSEIKRTEGIDLDIDNVPLDDAKTYQLFVDGQTYGIFQFESSGMREILRRAKPQRLEDLIAMNALYRPGPLKGGMVDDYINRKAGRSEVKYELASLEPILADTYGVIAYQEQVMRMASVLAGFTMGQSDVLRKAMGKKDPKVMAKQREAFMSGALAKGVSEKKASKIFELMEFFAGYGFNKSHSTAYAFLAYQTAYLKANYPKHFAAALLTIEAANTDKLAVYIAESRERGIAVLPPDINQSMLHFTVVPEGVRFGLTAIKGLGEGAINAIIEVRQRTGSVTSLHQLCEELDLRIVNKKVLEALVKSGACDSLVPAGVGLAAGRAKLFGAVDSAIEHGNRTQRDRELGQSDLFGGGDEGGSLAIIRLPDSPPWTEMELLSHEKDALGLYLSGHPIDRHAENLRAFGARTVGDLTMTEIPQSTDGAPGRLVLEDVYVGGIVGGFRGLKTKKGDPMCVFTLEDHQGSVEVVVFPEMFGKHRSLIENGALLLVRGKFERDEENSRFQCADIMLLSALKERLSRGVRIRLKGTCPRETIESLWEVMTKHRGDRPVAVEVELNGGSRHVIVRAEVTHSIRVRTSEQFVSDVERLCGIGSVTIHS